MTVWKQARCNGGGCLQFDDTVGDGVVYLRSSRRPNTVLPVDGDEWEAFLAAARAGEFDVPAEVEA